jgi:hypothetical protein
MGKSEGDNVMRGLSPFSDLSLCISLSVYREGDAKSQPVANDTEGENVRKGSC